MFRRLRASWRRLLATLGGDLHGEREITDELRSHLDHHIEDNLRAGMTRDVAERAARVHAGGLGQTVEQVRDRRGLAWLDSLTQDVHCAARSARRRPKFAVVAVLTLAIGIGTTTALFSLVYAVLLNPFNYEGADRTVNLSLLTDTGAPQGVFLTADQLTQLRRASVVEDAVATDAFGMTLTGGDLPEYARTLFYSLNGPGFLGIRPVLGRIFTEADTLGGGTPARVVILSYAFWRSRFAGATDVVGRTVQLDRTPYTIIGVAPPGFGGDILVPLDMGSDPSHAWSGGMVRLKPGTDLSAAQSELQALMTGFAAESPQRFPPGFRVRVSRLIEGRRAASFALPLVVSFAAAVLLLVVTCVTVSVLSLARGAARLRELAVRQAIGASRWRLVRQLMAESLVLALAGAGAGIAFAYWGTPRALKWLPPNSFPDVAETVYVSGPVLLFGVGLALLTSVLSGLSPALTLSRRRVGGLFQAAMVLVSDADHGRAHQVLVAAQVAFTVLLLAGTGAGVRSLLALLNTPLGYDPSNVLVVSANLPLGSYREWAARATFFEQLRARIASTPQVDAAGMSIYGGVPPRMGWRSLVEVPGRTVPPGMHPIVHRVSPEYFAALRIPVLRGRVWSAAEGQRATGVAVVTQGMARAFWPGADPIGQRIHVPELARSSSQFVLAAPGADGWMEVVGVVGDTPNIGLHDAPAPAMYVPHTVMLGDGAVFAIRTTGAEPLALLRTVREQMQAISPGQAVAQARTAQDALDAGGWARERFVVFLLSGFGVLALVLAVVGLFSVVSFSVARRVREFGIRLALGARRTTIATLALRPLAWSIAAGLVVGVALSTVANALLARWSIGDLTDPVVLKVAWLVHKFNEIAAADGFVPIEVNPSAGD
ncbi:MAG: FtsX-like permease family protein [Acidimicrobiia bacterium]|nr:FtsX-like permease family protein [Acidimicrobiia bacterium]